LEENDEVTFEVFNEKVWDNIREIYRQPGDVLPPHTTDEAASNLEEVSIGNVLWFI